ncbi:MAG: iron ABC transporter permease [Spirochaetaceae bacterium]|nr:iron ABC transporter permease [Spirochaetaceae bacterium]
MTSESSINNANLLRLKFNLTRLKSRTYYIMALVFIFIFAFLVIVPLLQIIFTSLTFQRNDVRMVRGARVGAFTLYHYSRVFVGRLAKALFYKPFINSLMVGFGVTVLSMVLGSLLAWILVRTDIPFKKFLNNVIVIPYMMPSWVMALAWLLIFKNTRTGGTPGMLTVLFGVATPDWVSYGLFPIIICLGLHYYAYSFLLVSGALATINSELEEAGALTGLNRLKVLKKITFPLVLPALGSSFVLTFSRSMGTFGTPALLGLPVRFFTIPTQIYASINARNKGDSFVLALVLVVLAAGAIYINSRIIGKRKSFVTMGGKGFRSRLNKLGSFKIPVTILVLLFLLIVIVLPVVLLAWNTFMLLPDDYSWSNLTLHFWTGKSNFSIASGQEGIFRNSSIGGGILNSLKLGVSAAIINAFLGLLIGYAVVRSRGTKISGILEAVSFAPYVFPSIAMGAIYLGMFAHPFGPIPALYGTFYLILLIVIVKNMPFSSRTGISAILQIDKSLEEVAQTEGIPWFTRLRKIIFPLSKSGFFSGMILTFITSMRELSLIILLVTPSTRLLTSIIFAYTDQDMVQHANGVTLILMLIIVTANFIARRFFGTKSLFGLKDS